VCNHGVDAALVAEVLEQSRRHGTRVNLMRTCSVYACTVCVCVCMHMRMHLSIRLPVLS
jgi:hypothetical protein